MSGASAHKSRTQRQARRLAADLAKGRMPASTVDLEDYLDRFPDDVFVALDLQLYISTLQKCERDCNSLSLSSEPKCNTPADLIIGTVNPQRPWQRRANPVHVKLC